MLCSRETYYLLRSYLYQTPKWICSKHALCLTQTASLQLQQQKGNYEMRMATAYSLCAGGLLKESLNREARRILN